MVGVVNGPITLPGEAFLAEKRVLGCLMGSVRFREDIPYLLDLHSTGLLKLDEAVSRRVPVDQINDGYAAVSDGSVARSVVVFD